MEKDVCLGCDRTDGTRKRGLCPSCYEVVRRRGWISCTDCDKEIAKNWTPRMVASSYRPITCRSCHDIRGSWWNYVYRVCVGCETDDQPHYSEGYCAGCAKVHASNGGPYRCSDCSDKTYENYSHLPHVVCRRCFRNKIKVVADEYRLSRSVRQIHLSTGLHRTIVAKIRDFLASQTTSSLAIQGKEIALPLLEVQRIFLYERVRTGKDFAPNHPIWQMLWEDGHAGNELAWTRLWELCDERFIRSMVARYHNLIPYWANTTADMAAAEGFREGIHVWFPGMNFALPQIIGRRVKGRLLDALRDAKQPKRQELYAKAISLDGGDDQNRHDWLTGANDNNLENQAEQEGIQGLITRLSNSANLHDEERALLIAIATNEVGPADLNRFGELRKKFTITKNKILANCSAEQLLVASQ